MPQKCPHFEKISLRTPVYRIFKRLTKSLIRLRICTGWSEALLVAHTTLLEIPCHGSCEVWSKSVNFFLKILSGNQILELIKGHNSGTNVGKMMCNNLNADLANMNGYTVEL